MNVLNEVSNQLRRELHLRTVTQRLLRGSQPGRIRVNFEIERREVSFDVAVPKFLYHSEQKFSGEVDAITRVGPNSLTLGVTSNGDDLTERFTGVALRYENSRLGSDRVHFGVEYDDFHEQWRPSTVDTAREEGGIDLYHARRNFAPEFTFVVAKPFTVSFGASFEQMEAGTPGRPDQSANALTAGLRYNREFEGSAFQQQLGASYSLRAGTRGLGSDYAYSRHMVTLRYELRSGRQLAREEFLGGMIAGSAPMFERFVLGSSETLRGWDRYVIDPLGGTRVVHNSITYGYQIREGTAEVFYDAGSLWESTREAKLRHSVGIAYRQGIFVLTMAFPVVEGRITPVFMAGMNY
jgi:outer membrane protein assembly factor BamA